jgi:exopolyphosphatase/guanosine-5'-triphosphate,3'-diphosphate pyrophosphatase
VTRAASIDIGTNTIRLLIADIQPDGRMIPLRCEHLITRLGEGFHAGGMLSEPACRRTLNALDAFSHLINAYPASRIHAVATSVVREAGNGADFCSRVAQLTGIIITVLSGAEEARLTLAGVLASVRAADLCLIVDIGGGSTELILAGDGLPLHTTSVRLGVVHLSEALLHRDPPSHAELLSLNAIIHERLDSALAHDFSSSLLSLSPSSVRLIGTAGTITTLAAIDQEMEDYDPARISNHRLSRATIDAIFHRLAAMMRDQRTTVAGLEKGREDLIIPGTAILLSLMHRFGCDTITVSDGGLLEGILIDTYRQPHTPDDPPHRSGFCLDSQE